MLEFPPLGAIDGFTCQYPGLKNKYIALPDGNQSLWLQPLEKDIQDEQYDIDTDYEIKAPTGVIRDVYVNVTKLASDKALKPDGVAFPEGKYINGSYPGPRIQACWGDTVRVHVTNKVDKNGTAIHMHGIRMLNTGYSDGVPGVTQCPIAVNDTFTYEFQAVQYGTTWYHSHYSLQYTDGMLGPLTIYGPASVEKYDETIEPLMLADHVHQSAFAKWTYQVVEKHGPRIPMASILINDKGSFAGHYQDNRYKTDKLKPGKKYLLRLINAATDTAFIFSIDEHKMKVIGADLVPVEPYDMESVYIGIGQRYHVIVETKSEPEDTNRNYWIRTWPATGCHNFDCEPNERQGIFQYNPNDTEDPISTPYRPPYGGQCRDEDHDKLFPMFPWTVPKPTPDQLKRVTFPFDVLKQDNFTMPPEDGWNGTDPTWSAWEVNGAPAWVNYQDLTINHLDDNHTWPANAALFELNSDPNSDEPTWAYMVIDGGHQDEEEKPPGESIIPAAHPMHLHGHDFALLKQSYDSFDDDVARDPDAMQGFIESLTYKNPARRDVVLLPKNGYVVIAFKLDNPGTWLLHCHIAWHASGGLALQILEDKDKVQELLKKDINPDQTARAQIDDGCAGWKKWWDKKENRWNPDARFQDDSGV
ncbi:CAZyme family AA1 [Aspergillus niger]|nr:CAZyme family AA1 [Aspergillus niger]